MPRRARTSARRAPSQKRGEDTVGVLLRATEIVMARHGFHGATTNRIAEAAGVSIGTLYHYFPSKEALVEAVVHQMWARELSTIEERESLLDLAPANIAIEELVVALIAVMSKHQELYRRWYGEASHLGQEGVGLKLIERATALVHSALERRRAEILPENLAFAANLVVKTVTSIVRTAPRDYPNEVASGELARELSRMVARYLMRAHQ